MKKRLKYILSLLILSTSLIAQVPYAFRYQASVRNIDNKATNEDVNFQISIFNDTNGQNEIYSEYHTVKPDANGLVAFSIGQGESNNNFNEIIWANGPYYIQVSLNEEVISYSQLMSVPYAMHAETANKIHDLQTPVLANDPTTKSYVDQTLLQTIDSLNYALKLAIERANAYADSLAIAPKDLKISSNGDTLTIGGKELVIAGMSSQNAEKHNEQLTLGGSYNESITQIIKTNEGGFLILASTLSGNGDVKDFKGDTDIWLIKLSATLKVEWTKTLGGNAYDNGVLIIEEEDGYLVGATTESKDGDITENKGEFDIWLVKLDKTGNIIWQKTYGGPGTEFLNAIIPNNDNTYYIGATTFSKSGNILTNNGESDIWIFKIDDRQEISTENITIGGSHFDQLHSMKINENGNLKLFGSSSSNDGNILANNGALDLIQIELNSNFDIIEQKCFGTSANEQLYLIENDLLIGHSYSQNWNITDGNSLKNICLYKIDEPDFEKNYGGSQNELIKDVININDTITIISETFSQDGDIKDSKGSRDIWIIQIDKEGNIIRNKTLGGTYDDTPKLIEILPDGNWIIACESESNDGDISNNSGKKDIWIAKLNANFEVLWQKNYGGSYTETITDIHIIDSKNFIIFGTTSSNDYGITGLHDKAGISSDIWILKTQIN